MNEELYHHGIKGQKWGIRRFQKKDGSLTSAGKKRYQDDPEVVQSKKDLELAKSNLSKSRMEFGKASNDYNNASTKANKDAYEKARAKFDSDKAALKKAKLQYNTNKEVSRIREKDITFDNKSKHRLRLEEQYKKMGMSDEQAQAAANNRMRTEKILAATAALTIAACATYAANKKIKNRVDGVIKAGEKLQRVEMRDTGGKLHDSFFVAQGKHDKKRYENLLGMTRQQQTGHAYLMKLESTKDIKVASKDNAAKAFGDLYKNDPDFKKSVEGHVKAHFSGKNRISNTNNLSDRNIKKMYENFNANIMFVRGEGSGADKKFYAKLKSAGYGAIQDINDMKYSGYAARNPLIVFDGRDNIMVRSVTEITDKNLTGKGIKEGLKAIGESSTKKFIEKAGPLSAAGLTAATVSTYNADPSKEQNAVNHMIRR